MFPYGQIPAAAEEAGASGDSAPKSKTKMWISGIILLGVVACMAFLYTHCLSAVISFPISRPVKWMKKR
ncbi:hypothetical protein [Dialister invisus]|uniref:hypothetical protein n=1 Tax=Dialister invisus TaxID=218538 RepID=UPI00258BA750|nr:hypothetical protein [Dialister invisus]